MSTITTCAWGKDRPVSIYGLPRIITEEPVAEPVEEVVVETKPTFTDNRKPRRNDDSTVKVNNFPDFTTEDDLFKLFSRCGHVQRVHIVCDHETGRSKGFAFISFRRKSDAEYAVQALHRYGFNHSFINVMMSIKK
jgi:RNA recognition motif-containing protein